jgi:hypothetical protein
MGLQQPDLAGAGVVPEHGAGVRKPWMIGGVGDLLTRVVFSPSDIAVPSLTCADPHPMHGSPV